MVAYGPREEDLEHIRSCVPKFTYQAHRDTPQHLRQLVGCSCHGKCVDRGKGDKWGCEHLNSQEDEYKHMKGVDQKPMKGRLAYDEHKKLRLQGVSELPLALESFSSPSRSPLTDHSAGATGGWHGMVPLRTVLFPHRAVCGRTHPERAARFLPPQDKEAVFIHECNSKCSCGDGCPNRVMQKGLTLSIEVFYAGDKGWGVRICEPVSAALGREKNLCGLESREAAQ